MMPIKTMAELARLAGVSSSTVSRALSGHASIPPATRARIAALAQEHQYRLNTRARNLRLQRSHAVAAVFPQASQSGRLMSDPFYLEILGALSDELSFHGYDLLISRARGDDDSWYQRYVLDKRADGLLLLERDHAELGVQRLMAAGVPFVVWGPLLPNQRYISVGGDSLGGAVLAVRHLLQEGRKQLAFVGGDESMIETKLRFQGFKQALTEAGQAYQPQSVMFTDYTPAAAQQAVAQLLQQQPATDGIFFCSDFMALAAYEVLRERGLRIPQDIAIVGYDDIPLASLTGPPLSTIRQEIAQGGRLMVQKLLAILADKPVRAEELPIQLKVRGSSTL